MNTTVKTGYWRAAFACLILVLLAACSTGKRSGGYYKDDGPEANPPANLERVPDAVPRLEPLASGANKPYVVFGRNYTPDVSGKTYRVQGRASWYGKKFHGNPTSNGERYDMYAMTAAHTTLPIPSYVRVTRVSNGKSVVLRVNDRGPFHSDRVIDLSYVAAFKLGMLGPGSSEVLVERIMPEQIRNWQATPPADTLAGSTAIEAPSVLTATVLPPASASIARSATDDTAPKRQAQELLSPAASSPQPLQTPVLAGAMFLQLGAFSDPDKAQSLAARATQQMPANLSAPVLIDRSATNLYRVRIGPFASRDAAVEALTPVSQATGVTPSLSLP